MVVLGLIVLLKWHDVRSLLESLAMLLTAPEGHLGACSREVREEVLQLWACWSLMISGISDRGACVLAPLLCALLTVSQPMATTSLYLVKSISRMTMPSAPTVFWKLPQFCLLAVLGSVHPYHNCGKISILGPAAC